jgi:hypothetical protein
VGLRIWWWLPRNHGTQALLAEAQPHVFRPSDAPQLGSDRSGRVLPSLPPGTVNGVATWPQRRAFSNRLHKCVTPEPALVVLQRKSHPNKVPLDPLAVPRRAPGLDDGALRRHGCAELVIDRWMSSSVKEPATDSRRQSPLTTPAVGSALAPFPSSQPLVSAQQHPERLGSSPCGIVANDLLAAVETTPLRRKARVHRRLSRSRSSRLLVTSLKFDHLNSDEAACSPMTTSACCGSSVAGCVRETRRRVGHRRTHGRRVRCAAAGMTHQLRDPPGRLSRGPWAVDDATA